MLRFALLHPATEPTVATWPQPLPHAADFPERYGVAAAHILKRAMKVTILYFSQTGSTRKVAETMADAVRESGHVARTVSLKKATALDATSSDLLGVGTPCFASQAPTPIKTFLSNLPPMAGQRVFVFATSGAAPGRVLYDLSRALRSKGAEVVGGFLTRGEVHHPAPGILGRMPQRPNAEDLGRARRFAAALAEHVSVARPGLVAESRPDTLQPKERFYNLIALMCSDRLVRWLLPEPKPDLTRCD